MKTNRLRASGCLLVLMGLCGASASQAIDGVIEINQAKVTASGGFPYTISAPGSYQLTSDLRVPDFSTVGIEVAASDVTLDLGGFKIWCGTSCTGSGGEGVRSTAAHTNVTVRNGTVREVGGAGIEVRGANARVYEVRVVDVAGIGIDVASGCYVADSQVDGTGFLNDGIDTSSSCLVVRNTVRNAGLHGIKTAQDSNVIGNTANGNTGSGIQVGLGCRVSGNTASDNGTIGIFATDSLVENNVANDNGQEGINATNSLILGNTANSNGGVGLFSNVTSAYGDNQFDLNNSGGAQTSGSPDAVGGNVCAASLVCP